MTAKQWQARSPGLDGFELVEHRPSEPGAGEVRIAVHAAGVNPADLKHIRRAEHFPLPVGYEVAGLVTAVGPDTVGGSGPLSVGDRVVAFRVRGGYATDLTFPAEKAFVLPDAVDDVTAAGLLLASTTAADMLHRSATAEGDTIVVHGASGAVGATVLQLAARDGVEVIGTASPQRLDAVRRFGATAVPYGYGLLDRIRRVAPDGVDSALDLTGTEEAVHASLDLVPERSRIITAAAKAAAVRHGFVAVAGLDPQSTAFRDAARPTLIELVGSGDLAVPIARTFALEGAVDALALVSGGHAGGKVVLTTSHYQHVDR